ncbi:MAG: hypothetical protein IKV62_03005 [Bacteroidales bacterium]|nr:hypothetical protein [Bacteroidales bacterium]
MKTPHPIIIKSVSTAVAAGVLIPSCTVGYNFDDSYYGPHAANLPQGSSFFSLENSNLSEEFINRLMAIQQIVNTVLSDKDEAKLFANNPEEYIANKEISFNITLQEPERKVLLALADNDILEAVRNNDIETFLSLCSDRGYLGIINEYNRPESIRSYFKTEEDYNSFLALIENLGGFDETRTGVAGIPVAVVAGAVAFMGAAVLYAAAAAVTGGVESLVVYHFAAATKGLEDREVEDTRAAMYVNEPTLRIWTENNGMISSDVFYSEMIEKQVNMFMDLIEKDIVLNPSSTDAVRNLLRIQFEGYYGLRK